jgi:uncharacterized membrane protein
MLASILMAGIPKELAVFGIAMLPVSELRGAIPYGLLKEPGLPVTKTYVIAVLGNFVPVIPIMLFLEPVSNVLRRVPILDRLITWFFARTRRRGTLVEKYEAIGLTLFVAIPLPVTGAWTGSILAFLFGIRLKWAVPCIILGIMIAGVVVTLASLGMINLWRFAA